MKSDSDERPTVMMHLAAFTKASAGGVSDEDIPAVSDQVFTISNNHFIPPVPIKVIGATAFSSVFSRFKISTPKLRAVAQPQFPRGSISALVVGQAGFNDLTMMPLA